MTNFYSLLHFGFGKSAKQQKNTVVFMALKYYLSDIFDKILIYFPAFDNKLTTNTYLTFLCTLGLILINYLYFRFNCLSNYQASYLV